MKPANRRIRQGAIAISVAAAIGVAYLIWRWRFSGFQWSVFAATFAGVNWLWLSLSIAGILLTYYGRVLRWEVMLRPLCPHPSRWRLLKATTIGFTAVVLFGRPGELVRPYLISKQEGVSFPSQIAAWFLERIYDLLMVLLIFGVALTQVSQSDVHPGPKLSLALQGGGYLVGVSGAVCLAILVLYRRFSGRIQQRLVEALGFLPDKYQERIAKLLAAFGTGMESARSGNALLLLLLYTLLEWVLIASSYRFLFWAFPATAHLTLTDVLIFLGFVSFGSAVQIPGVGGGMQVAAVLVFTEFFGMQFEVAAGLALVIWLVSFVTIVPIGLGLALHEGVNWSKLRHLEESAEL